MANGNIPAQIYLEELVIEEIGEGVVFLSLKSEEEILSSWATDTEQLQMLRAAEPGSGVGSVTGGGPGRGRYHGRWPRSAALAPGPVAAVSRSAPGESVEDRRSTGNIGNGGQARSF